MNIHIGKIIKDEVERRGLTADQFAGLISTSRTNVYHIYNRDNIDMELLQRISSALHRNFFAEMYNEMASILGAASPPVSWANMKMETLRHPLRETGERFFSEGEFTKDREQLKDVLREYFDSDHRMPLLILESGYTFGAREVVKQVAAEAFSECGSVPCPRSLDVARLKVMPEKVLVDYIDKNTFDALTEGDRRIDDLCRAQRDLTKKFVCIIHADPALFALGKRHAPGFEHWASVAHIMLTRYEHCFVAAYRWNRASLLSWALDNRLHQYVTNYIMHHKVNMDDMDFQLTHCSTSLSVTVLGGPAHWEGVGLDYPTAHAYYKGEWEYASDFFKGQRDINNEYMMRGMIEEIYNFNMNQDMEKNDKKTVKIECHIEVNGFVFECQELSLPVSVASLLPYLYQLAAANELKGLDAEQVEEEFFGWLRQHHPLVAKALVEAADAHFAQELALDTDGQYRDNIPHVQPNSVDDTWAVADGVQYGFVLYGIAEWN